MSATTAAEQICDLDLKGISEGLRVGAFSSVEVTEAYLRRIERHDGVLQSYITVTAERALEQARRADAALARGDRRGPLHGVPIAIKDLVAVAGVKMTGGSRVLGDHVPAENAFVARQLDEAGAGGPRSMHNIAPLVQSELERLQRASPAPVPGPAAEGVECPTDLVPENQGFSGNRSHWVSVCHVTSPLGRIPAG